MDEEQEEKDGPTDSQRLLGDSSPSDYHSLTPAPSAKSDYPEISAMAPPIDRLNGVYVIFYVLGLGTLLPWNFFITANDYWLFKLRMDNVTLPLTTVSPSSTSSFSPQNLTSPMVVATHESNLNQLQKLFQNALSVCAMLPNVIFQFLNTLLQRRVPEKARILVSLSIMILIFILTEVLVKMDVSTWTSGFFLTTMISVVILNICSAVFQSSLFGMASNLPSKYIQALMAGQGMGGLFAAVALIASLGLNTASGNTNPIPSAFAYFLTAIAVLLLTGICYFLLLKNKFYLHHSKKSVIIQTTNSEKKTVERDDRKSDSDLGNGNGDAYIRDDPYMNMKETNLFKNDVEFEKTNSVPPLFLILKKIWIYYLSVALIFFITLSCFPAITSKVKSLSEQSPWSTTFFSPVCCFLLFNLTDWMGRTLAGYLHFPSESYPYVLLLCSVVRCVFPALFVLCNAHPRTTPVVFNHDAYFIIFMILFGLSNGYFGTLAMQYGPKKVDVQHAATAGSMLAFAISIGLAAGAAFSFVVVATL